jgi:hypothetical protein
MLAFYKRCLGGRFSKKTVGGFLFCWLWAPLRFIRPTPPSLKVLPSFSLGYSFSFLAFAWLILLLAAT